MGSIWTVTPEETTIDLAYKTPDGESHAFWIRIKKRLNIGEERRIATAGWRSMSSGARPGDAEDEKRNAEIQIDWRAQTFARTQAYLIDWSLADDKGAKLDPKSRDVIEALHPDVYVIIEDAITKHVEAMEKEKKAQTGKSEPSAMSA